MKKSLKVLGAILSLFVIYIFLMGLKYMFKTDKVYIGYNESVFHSSPICPRLGINELDIEYMEESGNIVGSKEFSELDCWNDTSLEMCVYCYSKLDREIRKREGLK